MLVVALCLAFGLRVLLLIDATALWSDELYSVGKFQPGFSSLLVMPGRTPTGLRPALVLGHLVGQSHSACALSWLAYLAGGLVMVEAMALAQVGGVKVGAVAALLAFAVYPIRFAIEGKSYAVLVLLVALAWWWRRSGLPSLMGRWWPVDHFYGLFLVLAAAAGWLATPLELCCCRPDRALPALAWMAYAADYLFSSRAGVGSVGGLRPA